MAILFLTGGLEPGRDGVGDYTRLLAGECVRQRHACGIIALNDPRVPDPVESADDPSLPTLRLPARLPWPQRAELAAAFRARRPVDWISLQFVSYGFDRRGMVGNLARHLEPIVADLPLHLMFHELWIGVGQSPPLKDRVMGQIQRHYLRELVRQLQPRSVTTTNPFYRSLLETIRLPAEELPLFGNIPVGGAGDRPGIPDALVRAGLCDERGAHPGRLVGLFFGALYPEWKPEPLLGIMIAAAAKTGRRARLVSAGRLGGSGEAAWKKLQAAYARDIDFVTLGEQPVREIAALMQVADFGLAASPRHLIEKSGSVAAMLDHGLPVIVAREEGQAAASSPDDPLLHRCDAALEFKLVAGLPRRPARNRVEETARHFLHILTESAPPKTP